MDTIRSHDGTPIAYDRVGAGPPLILVVGAFNARPTGTPLAARLADRLTVVNYDRRGRGMSGDTAPYAVAREIEDLEALLDTIGGVAAVFGYSSGAIVALQAAARGLPITRLVLYDPPFLADEESTRQFTELARQLAALIGAGRRGEAVALFQTQAVGIPPDVVDQLRHAPFWPALEEIAHTLVYDATILGDMTALAARLRTIAAPTLVLSGAENQERLLQAARAVAAAVPQAEYRALPGQTHDLDPEALAPIVEPFVTGEQR